MCAFLTHLDVATKASPFTQVPVRRSPHPRQVKLLAIPDDHVIWPPPGLTGYENDFVTRVVLSQVPVYDELEELVVIKATTTRHDNPPRPQNLSFGRFSRTMIGTTLCLMSSSHTLKSPVSTRHSRASIVFSSAMPITSINLRLTKVRR
jgi:hypothetical protein